MTRKQIRTAFAIVDDVKRILAADPKPGEFVKVTAPPQLVSVTLFMRTHGDTWLDLDAKPDASLSDSLRQYLFAYPK